MKTYYVNFCVSRAHTENTADRQIVLEMPDDYMPIADGKLHLMRKTVDKHLTFYTESGEGITIKSFSRMDI